VTTANVSDQAGALAAFEFHAATLSDVENVLVDGGYRGEPFARAVQEVLGAGVEVVKRSDVPRFRLFRNGGSWSGVSRGWRNAADCG